MQGFVTGMLPEVDGIAQQDLLSAAVSEVNWLELARAKCDEIIEEWTREASEAGADAAKSAATWTVDGNVGEAYAPTMLKMLSDGDPQVYDYLPRRPDLSGEYADDVTPLSLAREITSLEDPDPDLIDALADAYEAGVSETFEAACEAELRKAL